jgi:hypothetical protein
MPTIKARLEALEKRAPHPDGVDTVIVTFFEPSDNGPRQVEPLSIKSQRGDWQLERDPGEDLETFHQRAERSYPRTGPGVAMLVDVVE